MFCIYRYAVPIEMLAPLGIVLAVGLAPVSRKARWSAAALILAVLQATTVWGTWGRSPWTKDIVEFNMPAIPDPDHNGYPGKPIDWFTSPVNEGIYDRDGKYSHTVNSGSLTAVQYFIQQAQITSTMPTISRPFCE